MAEKLTPNVMAKRAENLAAAVAVSNTAAQLNQYHELAVTIANQAEALAEGKIPPKNHYAHVKLMANNVDTLLAWTPRF